MVARRVGCGLLGSALVACLYLGAAHKRLNPASLPFLGQDRSSYLGGEYDSIAVAVRSGRGFSDPFSLPTGPTAWMAPLYSGALAFGYWWLHDNRQSVVQVAILCSLAGNWLLAIIFLRIAVERRLPVTGLSILAFGLLGNFAYLFQTTHEGTFLGALVAAFFLLQRSIEKADTEPRPRHHFLTGLCCGLSALASPVLGFSLGVSHVAGQCLTQRRGTGWRRNCAGAAICVALGFALAIGPWTYRNYKVFGSLIPVKSNLSFEFWQSQCVDSDGVLDRDTLLGHPSRLGSLDSAIYAHLGEKRFLEMIRQRLNTSREVGVGSWICKAAARAGAAFLWYVRPGGGSVPPTVPEQVKAWGFPMPFICCVLLLANARARHDRIVIVTMSLYLCYFLIYVMISYFARYEVPMVLVKLLLVLFACQAACNSLSDWGCRQSRIKSESTPRAATVIGRFTE